MHVIGPQLGLTQPGMTIVCGDSHTSTLGAFGALAFGIGTSEVEHVLATQTLPQNRVKTMAVTCERPPALWRHGQGSHPRHHREDRYRWRPRPRHRVQRAALAAALMEGRMTVCNMSIEAGARAGMVAPDDTTFGYLEGRPHAPRGAAWEAALDHWRTLRTDDDATFDREIELDASQLTPYVTWGTNPGQGAPLDGTVPHPESFGNPDLRAAAERALTYMDLRPGTPLRDITVDTVFVGSCTNGRLEDLRAAADVLRGRRVADGVRMLVVPGSMEVKDGSRTRGSRRCFHRRRRRSGGPRVAPCASA